MRKSIFKSLLTLGVLTATASSGQENIDQLESRFDQRTAPRSQPGRVLPSFDPLSPPVEASQFQFVLGSVKLSGNSVFSDEELSPLFADLIGKRISVAQVFGIANQITTFYGKNGWPLSRSVVPAQEISDDGSIQLRIIEGFADKVVVEGVGKGNVVVESHAANIAGERPLSNKTLERNLLLADDLPGLSAKSVLKKSDDSVGATTVILNTEAKRPFVYNFKIDNRGSAAVGPVQGEMRITANDLIHLNSSTSLRLINASLNRELSYATLEHKAVVNSHGTTLTFGLKASRSTPGTAILSAIELETEAQTAFVTLSHPFIRSRNMNLYGYATLEARNSETQSLGAPLSRDKIRSLRFGADFDNRDEKGGLNQISLEFSKGLAGLGANSNTDPLNSREFGKVDYAKAVLDLSRTQQLGALSESLSAWSLHGAVMAQFANQPLLSSEECSIGGTDYGRAFDSSTLSGDRCVAGSLEVRYQAKPIASLDSLQFFGFYDVGQTKNIDAGSPPNWARLASAGVGARVVFLKRYSGSFEVSKQIRNSGGGIDHKSPRAFLSLSGEF